MPILAAFALANLKGDLAAVWGWLCHRSFWQLVSMALAGFALLQHFQLADARHDRDAYKKQRDEYHSALDKLAAESKAQQKQVDRITVRYRSVQKPDAEKRAKIIENAPLPGNCATPRAVLDADI